MYNNENQGKGSKMSNSVYNIPEGYEMGSVPGVYQRVETPGSQEVSPDTERPTGILNETVEVTAVDSEPSS